MRPPDLPESTPTPGRNPVGIGAGPGLDPALPDLTLQAFQLRSRHRHALHPVEAALQYHRSHAEIPSEEGHGGCSFEAAEAHYRAGAQGLRLSEIPQLAQQLRELSRLGPVDRAGRKALRNWAEEHGHVFDANGFLQHWSAQGPRGGAEHQVYYDPQAGRWFKRLYHGVNSSTLGDYLVRMRLHSVLFAAITYRRPNAEKERIELSGKSLRLSQDEAFRPDAEGLKWRCERLIA